MNGANRVAFGYENDSLLTSAGAMLLGWDAQNGLLTTTTLSNVSDSRSYNGFAEMETYSATTVGSPVYSVQYTRDKLGRITTKIETIEGQTDTLEYTYDAAGRLTDVLRNGLLLSHYDYDSNSNRLAADAIYDAQDRLTSYGGFSHSYNANGELQSKSDGAQTTSISY